MYILQLCTVHDLYDLYKLHYISKITWQKNRDGGGGGGLGLGGGGGGNQKYLPCHILLIVV